MKYRYYPVEGESPFNDIFSTSRRYTVYTIRNKLYWFFMKVDGVEEKNANWLAWEFCNLLQAQGHFRPIEY